MDTYEKMKDDNDWVTRCITWEVERIRPRGRPKKTWWDCVKNDIKVLACPKRMRSPGISGGQLRGNRLTQVHLEKWPLKRGVCVKQSVCVSTRFIGCIHRTFLNL